MYFKITLLTYILLLTSHLVCSKNKIILSDSIEEIGVRHQWLGILEDSLRTLTIHDVSSFSRESRFQYAQSMFPVNKNKLSAYWLRFSVINKSNSDTDWLIEIFDHDINYISFYHIRPDGTIRELHSGNLRRFNTRLFAHKNFEFDLPLFPGESGTFFIRIESANENVLVPCIRSYKKFIGYALGEYYLLGLFYGIILMMATYNFLLFISIRKKPYLFYVGYVLSFALYSMCINGVAFQYLWPSYPAINMHLSVVSLCGTTLFALLFTKSFLGLKQKSPRLNKLVNILILFRFFFMGLSLAFFPVSQSILFVDAAVLLVALLIGMFFLRKGDRSARYFVLAYSALFLGAGVCILEYKGFLISHAVTVYSMNIGILLDIVFLSVSLADRMRNEIKMREAAQQKVLIEMKEKKMLEEKINRELEQKVAERTRQLSEAMTKLEIQANEITRMNLMLDMTNRELKKGIHEIARTRVMKTHVDFEEFVKVYPDELACYRFLEELKRSQGFCCKKCGERNAGKGKKIFDRRCNCCGYNESITSNTIFHKLKFPIVKAFYLMYLVSSRNKITSDTLAQMLEMRKSTCTLFKRKILERMALLGYKEVTDWQVLILDREAALPR